MCVHLYEEIIHSLKLVDYLNVQADNPWYNYYVSHDVTSGSDITACIKIDKPLVIYIFQKSNEMVSITTLRT